MGQIDLGLRKPDELDGLCHRDGHDKSERVGIADIF